MTRNMPYVNLMKQGGFDDEEPTVKASPYDEDEAIVRRLLDTRPTKNMSPIKKTP